jgi:hypothetical protein
MKWFNRDVLILIGMAALLLFIAYAACIPCQFFGWLPMPNVEQVLISTTPKPITVSSVYTVSPLSKSLCVSVDMQPLIKQNPDNDFYKDVMEQWPDLDRAYRQTLRFYIDSFRRVVLFNSLLTQFKSDSPCVETDGLALGRHVAHLSFEAPFGQLHEYTWVFEVRAEGIVPEVTATAAP